MSENEQDQMIPTPSDFGHFLLEKELGHGGMGGVYLARDKMLDRKVGIKVMLKALGDDPAFVERFQREAQAAARLNHPNIAQIYSFGTEQGMPYIAMELVSGGSLDKDMAQSPGTLDPVRVMKIGQQIAEALALAAEQGLVHGDVKPENVLFDADGNAKLVDFGLAAMQGDSDEIWGTPYYISPEKVRRQKIDFRADIYSLGGTLYHALTGVAPFEGEDATLVVKARFDGPPKLPSEVRPDLPKELDGIIMRMLEMEPSMRYPTYPSLIGDIKRYLAKAGPVRTSRLASGKLKIKGTKMKLKTATANTEGEDGGEDVPQMRIKPLIAEAPKKQTNVGAMVGLAVAGVILAVLGTVGGLVWYVKHNKDAKRKADVAQTIGKIDEARSAIATNVKAAVDYADKFHASVEACDKVISENSRKMKQHLFRESLLSGLRPAAEAILSPAPTKDIAEAIAYTNKLLSAAPPATAEAKKPDEKKPAAKPDEKKADAKTGEAAAKAPEKKKAAVALTGEDAEEAAAARAMAEQEARVLGKPLPKPEAKAEPAKKPEEKPAAEEKPQAQQTAAASVKMPPAVTKFGELWGSLYLCRAADIRVQGHVVKIKKLAAKADDFKAETWETVQALAALSQETLDACESMKALKIIDQARRNIAKINSSGKLVSEADIQIQNFVAEETRKIEEEKARRTRDEEARQKRERLEKAKKEEPEAAAAKFDELVKTRLKLLDWDQAIKQLEPMIETCISQEGKEAYASQVKKVQCMKGLQEHFIKFGKDFKFKNGSIIKAVDAKNLTIQTLKSVRGRMEPDKIVKVEWTRFYGKTEYAPSMNDLINALVLKGRDTTKIGPKPWSEYMLGAALTLKHLYTEVPGAEKMAPILVKKAVKGFDDCAKWAKQWFPDVEIEAE